MTALDNAARQASRRLSRRSWRAPYLFLAPAGILFLTFLAIPIGYALYLSVRGMRIEDSGPFGVQTDTWAGFSNYLQALTDAEFLAGFTRLLVYGRIAVPLTLGFARLFAFLLDVPRLRAVRLPLAFELICALLLDLPRVCAVRVSRTAIFVPSAGPAVIASLLWGSLYLRTTSPLNWMLDQLGLPGVELLTGSMLYPAV